MDKKKYVLAAVLLVGLPIAAWWSEKGQGELDGDNSISLGTPGDGAREVTLTLEAEGILEDYEYSVDVPTRKLSGQEVEALFEEAQREIDSTFFREGEDPDRVTVEVYPKDSYAEGLVSAEWSYDNYRFLDTEGKVREDQIGEAGELLYVEAELSCEGEEMLYGFFIHIYPGEKSDAEKLLQGISEEIARQTELPGNTAISLPGEMEGVALSWGEEKEHTALKIVGLELAILVLLPFLKRERRKKAREMRDREFLLAYPDLVSKLTVLVGCGMPIKQAWNRISAPKSGKGPKDAKWIQPLQEEMLVTMRAMEGGESERTAYQNFAERIGLRSYYRLIRILIQNLEKGSAGLCRQLQRESETAFAERTMLARKLGEEASTKMIFPLIMMMGIVMVIVIAPAIIGFSI